MPQLDASTFAGQIFWLAVAFAVLYWLMKHRAIPRIEKVLEAREKRLSGDLDRAAQLRAEAEDAMARHEAMLADARSKAQEAAKSARDRLAAEHADRMAQLEADLAQEIEKGEARIAQTRDEALASLDEVAIDASSAAIERLLGEQVDRGEAAQALAAVKREAA